MPRHKPLPTQAELREAFDYNPETGELIWKTPPVGKASWAGKPAGTRRADNYWIVSLRGQKYLVHRLVWRIFYGEDPGPVGIDHADRNPANNRVINLRLASASEQAINQKLPSYCSSGFRGVWWRTDRGCWAAAIKVEGRCIHLGYYDTREAAAAERQRAAFEYFGEFVPDIEPELPPSHPLPLAMRPLRRNKSGFRGVCWHKGAGKWVAQIHRNGKNNRLGYFATPEEAAEAYRKAKEEG